MSKKLKLMGTTTSNNNCNKNCSHYQRKCQLLAPCCEKVYSCRLCHDDVESHNLVRKNVQTIVCSQCKKRQKLSEKCSKCDILFGEYSCLMCRLFDGQDRQPFHCDLCGICRVGGKENFFHCTKCNMCLSITIKETHKCLEDASKKNCPVCLEDIHTSRKKVHVPKCLHLMHMECYVEMTSHNKYTCPVCNRSLLDMSSCWEQLDKAVKEKTMPATYQNYHVNILCRDCQVNSNVKFHSVGLKCQSCGSYNTIRIGGDEPLPSNPDLDSEPDEVDEGDTDEVDESVADEVEERNADEAKGSDADEMEESVADEAENDRKGEQSNDRGEEGERETTCA